MTEIKFPFYAKFTIVLFGLVLLSIILHFGQVILIPLLYAVLLATLLNPFADFLQQYRISKFFAIIITVIVGLLIVAIIIYFISTQLLQFADEVPLLKKKLMENLFHLQHWLTKNYNIKIQKQIQWIYNTLYNSGKMVGQTFQALAGIVIAITLVPVYVFLLLYYKTLLINFLITVFSKNEASRIKDILQQSKVVIHSYIIGLMVETLIVAILNSTGLFFLGIEYAILLGVIGALLNLIPYVGGLVAIALPVMMALITKEGIGSPMAVVGLYIFIQFIDNNILVPLIVASKVRINALISILAVILGGVLWGVAGMFLSIPFVAILKIVCDRIESLKPWGLLLGDEYNDRDRFRIRKKIRPNVALKSASHEKL